MPSSSPGRTSPSLQPLPLRVRSPNSVSSPELLARLSGPMSPPALGLGTSSPGGSYPRSPSPGNYYRQAASNLTINLAELPRSQIHGVSGWGHALRSPDAEGGLYKQGRSSKILAKNLSGNYYKRPSVLPILGKGGGGGRLHPKFKNDVKFEKFLNIAQRKRRERKMKEKVEHKQKVDELTQWLEDAEELRAEKREREIRSMHWAKSKESKKSKELVLRDLEAGSLFQSSFSNIVSRQASQKSGDDLERLKHDISQSAVVKAVVAIKRRAQARVAGSLYKRGLEELKAHKAHKGAKGASKQSLVGGVLLVRVSCGDLPKVADKSKLSVSELTGEKEHSFAKNELEKNRQIKSSRKVHTVKDTVVPHSAREETTFQASRLKSASPAVFVSKLISGKSIGKFKEDDTHISIGQTKAAVRDSNPMFEETFALPYATHQKNLTSFRIRNMAGSVQGDVLGEVTIDARVLAQTCSEMLSRRRQEEKMYLESCREQKRLKRESKRRSHRLDVGDNAPKFMLPDKFESRKLGIVSNFDRDLKFLVMQSSFHDEDIDHAKINDKYIQIKKEEYFKSKWVNVELRVQDDDNVFSSKAEPCIVLRCRVCANQDEADEVQFEEDVGHQVKFSLYKPENGFDFFASLKKASDEFAVDKRGTKAKLRLKRLAKHDREQAHNVRESPQMSHVVEIAHLRMMADAKTEADQPDFDDAT